MATASNGVEIPDTGLMRTIVFNPDGGTTESITYEGIKYVRQCEVVDGKLFQRQWVADETKKEDNNG